MIADVGKNKSACLQPKLMSKKRNILQKDITSEIIPELLELFKRKNINISREQTERIEQRIEEIQNYQPKVAFFGKTGSGKSSLCNSIFGQDVAAVSDTDACTREPQEYLLKISGTKSIVLLDVPGVGETDNRDYEYEELYKNLLSHVDLLLWIIKADDRALAVDERIWKTLVAQFIESGCPVFIVINQVDKLNPVREWNTAESAPGPKQLELIEEKILSLSHHFDCSREQVVPVSATERYNISRLVEAIVFALPNEKKVSFLNAVVDEVVSDTAKTEAQRGFWESIGDFIKSAFDSVKRYIPTIVEVLVIVLGKKK